MKGKISNKKSKKITFSKKTSEDQIKFLKWVIEDLINKSAVPIVDLLFGKKHVNEFLIAKKLDLTINQTRNILYKLSDYGLVSFTRKKDKRKGWYIYFWTLNTYHSLDLLEKNLKEKLKQLQGQLKDRKEKRHYICKICSIEATEEEALLNDFICKECEEIYELLDDTEFIKQIEKDIDKIKKEIELVRIERQREEGKLEKKKVRKIKKAEEEKKIARRERMKARKKIKAALKKGLKKPIKKKPVKKVKKKVKKKPVKKIKKKVKKKAEKKSKKKILKKSIKKKTKRVEKKKSKKAIKKKPLKKKPRQVKKKRKR